MCLCAGAVLLEKRYRLGSCSDSFETKASGKREQTALAIVHGPGTQRMGKHIGYLIQFSLFSLCTHTKSTAQIFLRDTEPSRNQINQYKSSKQELF